MKSTPNIASDLMEKVESWFNRNGMRMYDYQRSCVDAISAGKSGILNAPTGSGKTMALGLPLMLKNASQKGLRILWITPLRALSDDIARALSEAAADCVPMFEVGCRNGDTPEKTRKQQKTNPPQLLVTTPESLHLLMSNKDYRKVLGRIDAVVADEWHELMSSKRGVMMELALAHLRSFRPDLMLWGISATIGNLEEAGRVLLGNIHDENAVQIRSDIPKRIEFITLLPDEVERYPWAGHLGIKMLEKLKPVLQEDGTALIFTNTRSQTEIWYQQLLDAMPELAGLIAMHHGSLSREMRSWVEEALHSGKLRAVVCTSSLDLGVDFRPVDRVIQIGSPKGIARYMQRAGRSGHRPEAISQMYFVPTHSLEILEAYSLRRAITDRCFEARPPLVRCFDVLIQFLVTLACGYGFDEHTLFEQVRSTHAFESIDRDEWNILLAFLLKGGKSLEAYDDFKKLHRDEAGMFRISSRRLAMRHRLSIGAIVSDHNLAVKFMNGTRVGTIEEWFISRLKEGDAFVLAGRKLELVRIEGMTAIVKKSNASRAQVPSWMGGRISLSSEASSYLMEALHSANEDEVEIAAIQPLLKLQEELSSIPGKSQLLMEYFESKEGYHLFVFPFEGRLVHEGLGLITAYRLAQIRPFTFSIAMNDYGFELLSDQPIPVEDGLETDLFQPGQLRDDIQKSINLSEMARRKFRDIAAISGLTFKGYPQRMQKDRHLQASASLFFDVFSDYDRSNLLLQQAYEEVLFQQLEENRLRAVLQRMSNQEVVLKYLKRPSPFCFPIMVDRLNRAQLSNESIEDRIRKMIPDS